MVGSLELPGETDPFVLPLEDQGLGCAPAVAEVLGNVFEWTPERIAEEVEAYSRCVALNQVWKNDAGESPTMSANGKRLDFFDRYLFLLGAAGCAKPCEQLVEKLCAEWNSPEKCEEWRHVANEAGGVL